MTMFTLNYQKIDIVSQNLQKDKNTPNKFEKIL